MDDVILVCADWAMLYCFGASQSNEISEKWYKSAAQPTETLFLKMAILPFDAIACILDHSLFDIFGCPNGEITIAGDKIRYGPCHAEKLVNANASRRRMYWSITGRPVEKEDYTYSEIVNTFARAICENVPIGDDDMISMLYVEAKVQKKKLRKHIQRLYEIAYAPTRARILTRNSIEESLVKDGREMFYADRTIKSFEDWFDDGYHRAMLKGDWLKRYYTATWTENKPLKYYS